MSTARSARFRSPASLPKPGFSGMAAPLRRLVTLVSVGTPQPWQREIGDVPAETILLQASLSDGTVVERMVRVTYGQHEREDALTAATDGDWQTLRRLYDRRSRAIERGRASFQKEFT